MARPLDILDSDWQQVLRSRPQRARFSAWQLKEPALAQFADAGALVRFMRRPGSRAQKDAVLGALLTWARTEPIGARVVLEAIRPGLVNLGARILRDAREDEELWSTVFLAAWEGIRDYPLGQRPRRIAANLLLDTLRRTLVSLGRESEWRATCSFQGLARHDADVPEEDAGHDLDALLDEAVQAGAVTDEEAETVLSSRFDGVELSELARAAGLSYNAMKLRRQRAEKRLLVFLGYRPVPRGRQKRPSSFARVAGIGSQGPVG